MATPAALLEILITANSSQAQAELAKTDARLKSTQKTALGTGSAFDKAFGKAAGAGTLAAFGVVMVDSVKKASEFQKQMALVQTQAGGSAKEVKNMSKALLEMAKNGVEFDPIELAKGLYRVESAGYRGGKALRTLNDAQRLADVGNADLEATTNALTGAMKSGIKGAQNSGKAIGTLNAIIGAGNMRMEDLTSAMGTGFLSNAKQMGVTLEQAGAALATLTVQGQPATQAATRLSMAFRMMMSPTTAAAEAMKSINLASNELGVLMQRGRFPAAVADLVKHLDALGDSPEALQKKATIIREMFGARSSAGINAILQGLQDYRGRIKQVATESGKFHEKEIADDATLASQWDMLKAKASAYEIEIGNRMLPIVTQAMKQMNMGMQGKGIAGAAFKLGSEAIKGLIGQALRFPAAGKGIIDSFSGMTHGGNIFGKALAGVNKLAKTLFGFDFGQIPRIISKTWSGLGKIMSDPFGSALNAITGFINGIIDAINTVLGAVGVSKIGHVGGGGNAGLPASKTPPRSKPAKQKQRGGPIFGSGSGDTIPAMLEPGEFVLNRNAVAAVGAHNLSSINNNVPRFQGGGPVGLQVGGAANAAAGAVGSALSGGGMPKLPSVGSLPGWTQPIGRFVLDKVGGFIKSKLASLVGGVGGDILNTKSGAATLKSLQSSHPELQPGITQVLAAVLANNAGLSITSTTGGGHVPGSFHYSGRAVDLGGSSGSMSSASNWIKRSGLYTALAEGIHNPNLAVDNGHIYSGAGPFGAVWAEHINHIHLAKQKGGLIQRLAGGGAVKAHKPWRSVFGSRFDKNELTTLGAFVGMPQAALMAAIAMAESAGNPTAMGGAGDKGLWQEIPSTAAAFGTNYGTLFNPIAAATGAKKVVQGQGLNAWTTYRSGAYRSFMGGRVNTSQLAMLRGTGAGTKTKTTSKAKGKATGQGKARWQAFLDKRDRGIQGMQAEVDAINVKIEGKNALRELWNAGLVTINERRSLINELRGAGNLELLQRYQTGMSQNALLGIATPGKPALASMLAMLPMLSMLPSMPDYVAPSLASLKAASRQKKQKKQVKKHVQQLKKKHQGAIAHYDTGGVVPGPIGSPQPAIVHGGETITPPGGGGDTHVHFYIDGREIQGVVKKVVKRQARGGNRPLPSAGGGM